MTVRLANGGTVEVLQSGQVEFRSEGKTYRVDGRGDYASTVRWVETLAYGPDIRYVSR